MKAFLIAMLALVVISVAAEFVLREVGFSAAERTTTGSSVRVGDDG